MKREYRKPTIEVVDIETMATCIQPQSWNIDGGKNSDDHGYIIEGKEEGEYGEDEYDPWKSNNW